MCHGLEMVNSRRDIEKLAFFSMDVCKMFPSLRASDVARIVKEEYLMAQLEVEVDDNELALFLAIEVGREELEDLGLGEVTNRRKRRGGRAKGAILRFYLKRGDIGEQTHYRNNYVIKTL